MTDILEQLAYCIERGKAGRESPYPPDLRKQNGASELCKQALQNGVPPNEILQKALMVGMRKIGDKFENGEAFIPELLIAAKAMHAAMEHLNPYFQSGEATHHGSFIIGTAAGDLHNIGKNIVKMVLEGNGWNVIDLGVDAGTDKFIAALNGHPAAHVGISALLTTTMVHMTETVKAIREQSPATKIFIGGAPVTEEFCQKIGADKYFPEPQSLVKYLTP